MRFLGMVVIALIAYAAVDFVTPMIFQQSLGWPNFLPGVVFAGIVGFLMRYWDGWLGNIQRPFKKQSITLETKEAPAPIVIDGCITFLTGFFIIASIVMVGGYLLLTDPPPLVQDFLRRLSMLPLISGK